MRKVVGILLAALLIVLIGAPVPAAAAPRQAPRPGAPGIGDPYFPTDGNGGYDVAHYDLDHLLLPGHRPAAGSRPPSRRAPPRRCRRSTSTSTASGDRRPGRRPARPLASRRRRADHHPATRPSPSVSRFTGRGALRRRTAGPGRAGPGSGGRVPHRRRRADRRPAARGRHLVPGQRPPARQGQLPVRGDRARGARGGRQRLLAGVQRHRRTADDWTWTPETRWPPTWPPPPSGSSTSTTDASTASVTGTPSTPPSIVQPEPRTGSRYAITRWRRLRVQAAEPGDRRPGRRRRAVVLGHPGYRAGWDFFFVEARRSAPKTGPPCRTSTATPARTPGQLPGWLTCTRSSPTTRPTTARLVHPERHHRGLVRGERRQRRLRAVAARPVGVRRHVGGGRRSTLASDDVGGVQRGLRRRRDRSEGRGHDVLRGRRRPAGRLDRSRSAARQPGQRERLDATASEAAGPAVGDNAEAALARQPEIIDFLDRHPRPLPVRRRPAASSTTTRASASRWRTRPGRSTRRTGSADPSDDDVVVVHELAHQWDGDSLALEAWQHIWLNEGFASYMEWLWSEHEGEAPPRRSSTSTPVSPRRSVLGPW